MQFRWDLSLCKVKPARSRMLPTNTGNTINVGRHYVVFHLPLPCYFVDESMGVMQNLKWVKNAIARDVFLV